MKKYKNFFEGMGSILEIFPSKEIKLPHEIYYAELPEYIRNNFMITLRLDLYRDWSNVNKDFDRALNGSGETKRGSIKSLCD